MAKRNGTSYDVVAHPADMFLYRDKFSTPRMREIWSERNIIAQRLLVEATLAEAQAELGMIPRAAAAEIKRKATLAHVTPAKYADMYRYKGHDIVALVWCLAGACAKGHGEFVHWRSTTQDILWTSTALLFKDTVVLLLEQLREVEGVMLDLMARHERTIMVGRTHGQHCPPITVGFYLGILALAVRRHIERMTACADRLLIGKITSAVGTGSSYGPPGLALRLQQRVCRKLGLAVPPITESEVTRDRVAEFGNVCSLVGTTFEKLMSDITVYQRPEIGEMEEPFRTGEQVGSSTLAHKRNPFGCEWVQGLARMVRAHAYALNELFSNDIRDGVRLAVEYSSVPSIAMMTSALLQGATHILRGLTIRPDRMLRNMDLQRGLAMDEPVMLALADHIGRQSAHDLVYECAMEAYAKERPLKDVLLEHPTVRQHLTPRAIDRLLRPENYLGTAPHQVRATIAAIRAARRREARTAQRPRR